MADEHGTPAPEEQPTAAGPDAPGGDEAPTQVAPPSGGGEQTPWERSRGRRIAVRALLVLAVILGVLSVFSVWARQQLLNTDQWTKTSSELLENQAIRDQLSTYLTDELYANVDVTAELQQRLPEELAPLAPAAAAGLRQLVDRAADDALANPTVQGVWEDANRVAHEQFVKVIEGGGPNVSTEGGVVTLDLQRILTRIGQRVGIPDGLLAKIPASAANIEVLRSDELETAQTAADVLKTLAFVLGPLALLTLALAVYLAAGRRRQTLLLAGVAAIISGFIVLLARGIVGNQVTDDLTTEASVRPAAEAVWEISTELLRTLGWQAIIIGLALMLSAWVAGPSRPATGLRRAVAPTLRRRPEVAYGVVIALLFLLIVWSPLPAFGRPIFILLLVAASIVGVWALRRETMAEFPEAEGGGTARVRERASAMAGSARQVASGAAASLKARAEPGAGRAAGEEEATDRVARLERLVALRDGGALSEEEFAAEKARLLGETPGDGA